MYFYITKCNFYYIKEARPPSFVLVLTVTADLVVDDLSRYLADFVEKV